MKKPTPGAVRGRRAPFQRGGQGAGVNPPVGEGHRDVLPVILPAAALSAEPQGADAAHYVVRRGDGRLTEQLGGGEVL